MGTPNFLHLEKEMRENAFKIMWKTEHFYQEKN